MNEAIEAQLQAALPALREKNHILHFSCGADSIAAHIRMRGWGIEPELVYMYYIDGLPLVENYIRYYEKAMGCHVYRLPNPLFWTDFEGGMFQKPGVGQQLWKYVGSLGWGAYTKQTYNDELRANFPDSMQAFGLRVTDGINRAVKLKKNGPVEKDTWFPVAAYGFNDIKVEINAAGVKLPPDYDLFGMSFESPRYWMMPILRDNCPETYRMILDKFPMMRLLCAQAEAIGRDMPGGAKRRKTIYAGMAMSREGLTW
jgi:hypothetical protein